jgi:hypothetical protein
MSAERELFSAYREWHRLARAGHRAIHKRDWNFLLESQEVTRKLQTFIPDLTLQARHEWKEQKLDSAVKENELREVILELMKLLESNKKLLCEARTSALSRREKIEQAGRNLKRLQGSYAPGLTSAWTSFS